MYKQELDWWEHSKTAFLAALVALAGSWFTYKESKVSATPDTYRALFERIEVLESEVTRISNLYYNTRAENQMLKMQIDTQFSETPRGVIASYLDAIRERPAWCKEYEESGGEFYMLHINSAYELVYDITAERYEGQTDSEVHDPSLAAMYKANDLQTLADKTFRSYTEAVQINNEIKQIEFWKFHVKLPDTTDLVCGIQVTA